MDTFKQTTKPALAVILARAGSKGLPLKNQLDVAGKPMIAWTIEHALNSQCIDRVVVSTDGQTLANIALGYPQVDVVMRPEELADDMATVDAAARHAVEMVDTDHESVVLLYGNIPVRPSDLSDKSVAMLQARGADSVQSVSPVGKHHPMWMKQVDSQTQSLTHYVENQVYRRQDLPPVYGLNGGIIAVTRDSLFTVKAGEPHAFLGTDRRAVVTGEHEVIDVDTEIDLWVAQAILARQSQQIRSAG